MSKTADSPLLPQDYNESKSKEKDWEHRYSMTSLHELTPQNIPLNQMSKQEIFELMKDVFIFTCSICLGLLLQMLILSINMHFVGSLEDPIYLDSLGFAIVIINCTGGFLMIGFNQGTGSFIGKAHGKKEKNLINNYFNKGLLMFISIYIVFTFIMYNADSVLILLNQEEHLARETQKYGTGILPGIFFNYGFDLLRNYLNGQEIYKPPMIILCLACPFHYIISSILFSAYGAFGTVYSTNITYFLIFVCINIYIYKSGIYPILSTKNLTWNLKSYAKECAAIALPLQIDVLGFEVNSILVGLLRDLKQFGAHIAFCNFTGMFFSFPVGMGAVYMLMTSNAVGKNCYITAQNYSKLAYITGTIYGLLFTILQISFLVPASKYYSSDPVIQGYFQEIMIIYAIMTIPDFMAQSVAGLLKGLGKSKNALIAFVFSYYIIGIPSSAILGLYTNLQLIGFWIGFGIAIGVIVCLMTALLLKINMKQQVNLQYCQLEQDSKYLEQQQLELQQQSLV